MKTELKKPYFLLLVLIGLLSASTEGYAQVSPYSVNWDTSGTYLIHMNDGEDLIGKYVSGDSAVIILSTKVISRMEIPVKNIITVEVLSKHSFKKGAYWFPNPNSTRYLFSPSAFNLKKGEGYYQNTYIFLNSFNVGVTDNISIGGGLEFFSTFVSLALGDFRPIFFVTPKASFRVSDNFHAGGGLLYFSIPNISTDEDQDRRTGVGIAYGIGTIGNTDHNLTGGVGWGFVRSDFARDPFLTISGMTRISRKTALVSENWLLPVDGLYGIYSYGFRFFGEKISVDLAFLNNADIAKGLAIGVPYVDFVVKF